jgi:MFS family permease
LGRRAATLLLSGIDMAAFEPANSLRSRTFLGLIVAQFFAAFNDQAIHAAAMFFAINTQALDEAKAISLMPILFYAPWALFCTVSGWLADRYSKRNSLVFWKVAEVLITLVALAGFSMYNFGGNRFGPYVVLSTVFLMGMHSAFFVPAKYGAMPEILQPHLLSRGNGLLESLSFLAIILGTVFGGILSTMFRAQEYVIGIILVGLAVVGAVASLLIQKMPAANPRRPFPPFFYQPLWQSIQTLLRSKPLAFAVVGIAFFTFIVTFMRSTVYMFGHVQSPRWTESKTSEVVGMVALGIGLGSPLVGYLSGKKVELGLVPIGACGMIVVTVAAALLLNWIAALIACIVLIGFFTGFYLVPMFTLLQHRAPKTSKGDSIATSNFINVTGAILAALVFFSMDRAAILTGIAPKCEQQSFEPATLMAPPVFEHGRPQKVEIGERVVETGRGVRIRPWDEELQAGDSVVESTFQLGTETVHAFRKVGTPEKPAYDKRRLPRLLYLSAAAMTLFTLILLWRQLPDLFLRTLLWCRWRGRYQLEVYGGHHLPGNGPAIVVTNAESPDACLQVLSAADRAVRFLLVESAEEPRLSGPARALAARGSLALLPSREGVVALETLQQRAEVALKGNQIVGVSLNGHDGAKYGEQLLETLLGGKTPIVPVYWNLHVTRKGIRRVSVVMGKPLAACRSVLEVREAIREVGETFEEQQRNGTLASSSFVGGH